MTLSSRLDNDLEACSRVIVQHVLDMLTFFFTGPVMSLDNSWKGIDRHGMLLAFDEAQNSYQQGGIPIGSVLLVQDPTESDGYKILGSGHNERIQKSSATLHGEISALENAGRLRAEIYRKATIVSILLNARLQAILRFRDRPIALTFTLVYYAEVATAPFSHKAILMCKIALALCARGRSCYTRYLESLLVKIRRSWGVKSCFNRAGLKLLFKIDRTVRT